MPTLLEIARALAGLWRLAHLDASGFDYFDRTIGGFWRSFRVAFLVAPIQAWLFVTQLQDLGLTGGWARILIVATLTYIVGWFLFPAVAYEICRRIDRNAEYPGYIAVYNWSAIGGSALDLLAAIPAMLGLISLDVSLTLSWFAYFVYLAYLWYIARHTLKVEGPVAGGFVLLDFVLTMLLSQVSLAMML
jgi:hypothetical protein